MYLVQRCTLKGFYESGMKVSDWLSTDYMGSAEFEFGALPASIRAMNKLDLVVEDFIVPGKDIYFSILADKSQMESAYKQILEYLEGKRLKEYISFKDRIENKVGGWDRDIFWWCIEPTNSFAFSLSHSALCVYFKEALKASLVYMDSEK